MDQRMDYHFSLPIRYGPALVAKTFPLAEAADALRYLVEGRAFGRVVLTI
jgi:hypothetical protein